MRDLPEVRWERMFPHQLEKAFAACPAVYFSYGLCEPHGPQAVVGLDSLKAHGLLVRLAQLIAGRSPGYPIATRRFQDRVPS